MSTPTVREASCTEAEAMIVMSLLVAAAVMLAAWIAGVTGVAIRPWGVLAVALAGSAVAWRTLLPRREQVSPSRLAAFLIVALGSASYILWLAWPSLLPISDGPDLVHHLTLVHFIQQRHALPPQDGSFGAYLGEMDRYPPGSHLLAAMAAEWMRMDGVRLIQPIFALATALKAGLIFSILLRVREDAPRDAALRADPGSEAGSARARAGPGGASVPLATAGTLLLFVPHAYLIEPIARYSFYAQVVSEVFAVGMLWVLVAWWQTPLPRLLVLFSLFGAAVVVCWPLLIPIPLAAMGVAVIARSSGVRQSAERLLAGAGPPVAVFGILSAASADSAGVLRSGGSVLVPGVDVFGWGFLTLVAAGLLLALVRRGPAVAIVAFVAGCALQIAALAVVQRALHATNLYLASKTVHLLVYPAVVLAGIALAALWMRLGRRPGGAAGRSALLAPALVVVWLAYGEVPVKPMRSPLTPEALASGEWAREHLPPGCVDYMFPHWLTGYWLHVDVLGNPRQSERTRHESFELRDTVGRWIEPGSLRYAIAGEFERLPSDARANMRVLQRFGSAAVVERSDGRGGCVDAPAPIQALPRIR